MYLRVMTSLFLLFTFMVNAQDALINIRGKVTDKDGAAVVGATVELVGAKLTETTGEDGSYTIFKEDPNAVLFQAVPKTEKIILNNGVLEFRLTDPEQVKVEIFDVKGELLKKELLQKASAGVYRLNILKNAFASKMLIINAAIGNRVSTLRYTPMNKNTIVVKSSVENSATAGGLTKAAAAIDDTLKISAADFEDTAIAITSYDQEVNVALQVAEPPDPEGVAVRLDQERQPIQGFGINACLMTGSIFPLDECFTLEGPDALGMSIMRIGMDTDGGLRGVPSGWERARDQYGAKIIGSCWSAPGQWKDNGSEQGGGHLFSDRYDDWATRIADFAKRYDLYAMSIANEADFESGTTPPRTNHYASMVYTGKEMAEFVGMTTENVIRTLSEFRKDDILKIYGKTIQIVQMDTLKSIAEFG